MPFDLAALLGAGQSNDAPPDAGQVAPQDPSQLAGVLNPPSGGAIDQLGKAPDEVAQDVAAKTAPTRPIQAMLTNTLSMMAREFQPISAPKPSFKQGVADAAASYAGIKTPFQNQVAARDSNMESLKTLVGANAIDFNQSRAQQTVRIGDMDMPLDVAKVYFPNYFKGVAEQGKNDRNDANIASREGMAGQRDDTKRLLGGYNPDGTLNAAGQQKFDTGTATLGLRAAQTALANAKAAGEGKRIAVAQGQLGLAQKSISLTTSALTVVGRRSLGHQWGMMARLLASRYSAQALLAPTAHAVATSPRTPCTTSTPSAPSPSPTPRYSGRLEERRSLGRPPRLRRPEH
jgi:hypothetical protein